MVTKARGGSANRGTTCLALALVGSGVGGHEADFIVGLDDALLDTACEDIANTLDLVDAGDGDTEGLGSVALRQLDDEVEVVEEGCHL
jgi:hypothetical protein